MEDEVMPQNDGDKKEKRVIVPYDEQEDNDEQLTVPLLQMIMRVNAEPPLSMVYSGIKEGSLGIIFGRSKSGKTMFAENLAFAIAAGEKEFLGQPLNIQNRKVVIFHLEEHYRNRTERNKRQTGPLVAKHGMDWLSNIHVVDDKIPRYLSSDKDWQTILTAIMECTPGFVVMDSLTHMHDGSIEESTVAKDLMKRLRYLCEVSKATIAVIHHTHKLYDKPLSIDTIAGSRVIAQEIDFMIGINRTGNGVHYIKEVSFRHAQCNSKTVKTFDITNDLWLNITGETEEQKLLAGPDGRRDDTNKNNIYEYFHEHYDLIPILTAKTLENYFVGTGDMSKQTLYTNLQKLIDEGLIHKPSKGEYSIVV